MSPSYEQVRALVAERLSPAAFGHSERVAGTAGALAERYGVDAAQARLAGLLHDWHRELPAAELVLRARRAGIPVTAVDEHVPYLLHGPVAAADLDHEMPGLPDAVLDAVAAHTYGAPDMSALAKVVYIADVLEPARGHAGVEALRCDIDGCSLDELFTRVYAASLAHLIDRRRRIHPQTVATWNDIVAAVER